MRGIREVHAFCELLLTLFETQNSVFVADVFSCHQCQMIDYRIQMIDWMKMNLAVYFLLLSLPKEIKTKDRKYGKAYEPEQKALAKAMQ